jgi:hypothetical protein
MSTAEGLTALAAGLQELLQVKLQLQAFSLTGSRAGSQDILKRILQNLPVAPLKQLDAAVDFSSAPSVQAVVQLTGLQQLRLRCTSAAVAADGDWIIAKQMLENRRQLHRLPRLRQLHITAAVDNHQQLLLLLAWLSQDRGALQSLTARPPTNLDGAVPAAWSLAYRHGLQCLTDRQQEAAAGAAAAAAAAAVPSPLRNLRSLSWASRYLGSAGRLLGCVSASSLTHLHCCLDWRGDADIAVLRKLTALRRLALQAADLGPGPLAEQSGPAAGIMLAHLSALQQLTNLHLISTMCREQLQRLPQLPQLQQLQAQVTGSQHALQLGHLTTLRMLALSTGKLERMLPPNDTVRRALQPDDALPPNLQELSLYGRAGNILHEGSDSSCRWEPVHLLTKLQVLRFITWPGQPRETGKLSALTSLTSLSSLELSYQGEEIDGAGADGAVLKAWQQLPVKKLSFAACQYGSALVQQLGMVHGLQTLDLSGWQDRGELKATLQQLAAALQSLKYLRSLRIAGLTYVVGATPAPREAPHDVEGVAAVLRAIAVLLKLRDLRVVLPLRLTDAAVQQVPGMLKLLPSWMVRYCTLQQDKLSITL